MFRNYNPSSLTDFFNTTETYYNPNEKSFSIPRNRLFNKFIFPFSSFSMLFYFILYHDFGLHDDHCFSEIRRIYFKFIKEKFIGS